MSCSAAEDGRERRVPKAQPLHPRALLEVLLCAFPEMHSVADHPGELLTGLPQSTPIRLKHQSHRAFGGGPVRPCPRLLECGRIIKLPGFTALRKQMASQASRM